ncbi:hypothetical protein L1987_19243 [Smallanthus sonchifolius]|uniref:Uncharacterized protein n=1 Tax=Smallanthus sonchifolius TaxID=185202 RepID=A0ACB9IPA5_9ASTR|nr:hypothetical protein L1987_19243 [Smallanthus sonchifolius]
MYRQGGRILRIDCSLAYHGYCQSLSRSQPYTAQRRPEEPAHGAWRPLHHCQITSFPEALANPIKTPDITTLCKEAYPGQGEPLRTIKCCPPNIGKEIKPFVFPKKERARRRWPAHDGSRKQVEKYKNAVRAMRALPDDHPHSFVNQAKFHCAYCNGGYTQVENGFPDIEIQIHNSWLFFPFHSWYLYFYERILGKLINDPTFALPYWNWDDPAGMMMPEIFAMEEDNNPLFDPNRNRGHDPPTILNLEFFGQENEYSNETQIECNLITVRRDLITNGCDTISFFGGAYVAGNPPPGTRDDSVGSVEAGSHTAMHIWVGDRNRPLREDMGNFYSSGYDPLFFAHHSNVDRMWKLWKDLDYRGHKDPTNPDWLNASYVFYDENQDLVRVYNKDCVDIKKLGYEFKEPEGPLPWLKSRPKRRSSIENMSLDPLFGQGRDVIIAEQLEFPVRLDRIFRVCVKRPAVNRTKEEKEKANEILMIKGITFRSDKFVKFDVFVNVFFEDNQVPKPCIPEYAGAFAEIPNIYLDKMMTMTSGARFALDELFEDTQTEDDEYARVTLVPRTSFDDLTISGIKIELVPNV